MKLWVVRYFITGDHGSHMVGIFDSLEDAERARKKYEGEAWLGTGPNLWTSVVAYELNKYYSEDEDGKWVEPK